MNILQQMKKKRKAEIQRMTDEEKSVLFGKSISELLMDFTYGEGYMRKFMRGHNKSTVLDIMKKKRKKRGRR